MQTGVVISGFSVGVETFVQDANRDGRDDLITRADSASPWMVSLAGLSGAGATEFQAAADWNRWIEHGYTAAGELDADAAYAKVLEEFSWVYNNVELELYPGLMKGPQATQQTQAGNDWDQAALLERRLQALPFFAIGDVTIVADRVRATIAQLRACLQMNFALTKRRDIRLIMAA
ncbi:MAG: hypothetical protein DCC67_19090 [Planctomycetota bacterium]|nr:MAG: hypothetical protein DCC67_19090 [Planctomycetota bacterium]